MLKKYINIMIIGFCMLAFSSCYQDTNTSSEDNIIPSINTEVKVDQTSFTQGLSLANIKPNMKVKDNLTSYLSVKPLDDASDFTYEAIDFSSIANGVGSQNHENLGYFVFSFFLCNSGLEETGYSLKMNIDYSDKKADEIVRIAIMIQESSETIEDSKMYIYAKSSIEDKPEPIYRGDGSVIRDAIPFKKENSDYYNAANISKDNFQVNQITKFSIIIWFEGWDQQCTKQTLEGKIKFSTIFKIL